MKITLRSLQISDYDELIQVVEASGLHPHVRGRDSRARISEQIHANRTSYLGAFEGSSLVGVVLGTHDTRKGWINRLAVLPEYRRHGIASKLVLVCERGLQRQGVDVWAALVFPENIGSRALFTTLGYETMPFIYYRKALREGA